MTGQPLASTTEVEDSLRRMVTSLMTVPLTIGKSIAEFLPIQKKYAPINVHLLEVGHAEVTMIYTGLIKEILAMHPSARLQIYLISNDDEEHQKLARRCSPVNPMHVTSRCTIIAWEGLYHHFWKEYVEKNLHSAPDIVISLHPGLHEDICMHHWHPTLSILMQYKIPTILTSCNEQEHKKAVRNLERYDPHWVTYGLNPFGSTHWKQLPLELDRIWAANAFRIVFKGKNKGR